MPDITLLFYKTYTYTNIIKKENIHEPTRNRKQDKYFASIIFFLLKGYVRRIELNPEISSCSMEYCIGEDPTNGKVTPTIKIKVYKFFIKATIKTRMQKQIKIQTSSF